ncbi:MAG: Gfo/Idh/MocA family oxidoreductase [Rhodopirellula sp.]|nr:Gfo/Idh/MocA family oxidoreductase [Rhodopirellula sp.]
MSPWHSLQELPFVIISERTASVSSNNDDLSRRNFIKKTVAAGAAAASVLQAPAPVRAYGAGERIRIGFIGPGGRGFGAHVKTLARLHEAGENIELAAVSDVYSVQQDKVVDYILKNTGAQARRFENYEDMLGDESIDAVCIATPDHWHAKQTIDAMKAGKHVYCEKPMTHTIDEALAVVDAWRSTGKVMQVGVQSSSQPEWDKCRELIEQGMIGKLIQFQTEYNRNSNIGQWRYYKLTKDMTPATINWRRWLGVDYGLAPDMPFDRAVFAQWRCYWPFGSGMYTDLFVHRVTTMLKATGLRYPARVVGAGGIFLEYDGRDVPDMATVVADFNEGCQLLVSSTMCNAETPIPTVIRGHFGSFVFGGKGSKSGSFRFIPERPQVTLDNTLKEQFIEAGEVEDVNYAHFKNFVDAIRADKPAMVNNPPDLGAAAIVTVNMGANSYRQGKAFFFRDGKVVEADASWAAKWEEMSKQRAKPRHVPGWKAGDTGSRLQPPEHMKLAGPWIDGEDPAP